MLFNTLTFAEFFLVFYCLYLILNHKWQNWLLLGASYLFYGLWDWRFLSLLLITTTLDYCCGHLIPRVRGVTQKKLLLALSIAVNLTILGFFKYFHFFTESMQVFLSACGLAVSLPSLQLVLPVGISFYTFKSMTYTIDTYRGRVMSSASFFEYALFVAFFPQILAGPIERASNMLPQIIKHRNISIENFFLGCYQLFWGLFLKMFAADNLARLADGIFAAPQPYTGPGSLIATYAFTVQIFCDFAGYSFMSQGLASCMGFTTMDNFRFPYFVTNPQDFWRNWHISLSTWLRDYLYIPLGGNKKGERRTYINLMVTMLLGGLWHGAAWTFVLWGAYHGMLLCIQRFFRTSNDQKRFPKGIMAQSFGKTISWFACLNAVSLGWLVFRVPTIKQALDMMQAICTTWSYEIIWKYRGQGFGLLMFSTPVLIMQLIQYRKNDLLAVYKANTLLKACIYVLMFYMLILWGVQGGEEFIYFRF